MGGLAEIKKCRVGASSARVSHFIILICLFESLIALQWMAIICRFRAVEHLHDALHS